MLPDKEVILDLEEKLSTMSNLGIAKPYQKISHGISFQLPTHPARLQSVVGGENQTIFDPMILFPKRCKKV